MRTIMVAPSVRRFQQRMGRSLMLLLIIVMMVILPLFMSDTPGNAQGSPQPDPTLPPTFGTLTLYGAGAEGLDPFFVSVYAGGTINVNGLGENCDGFVYPRPTYVVDWVPGTSVHLRMFMYSDGNPFLMVYTPGGEYICQDDVNPLVLDPLIDFANPPAGRYVIWVGLYDQQQAFPGLLVLTETDLNPATFDFKALIRREPNPAAAPVDRLPRETLLSGEKGVWGDGELSAETPRYSVENVEGGGDVYYFNLDLNNRFCTGFGAAAPAITFSYKGTGETPLRVFFEGDLDGTLIVIAEDGRVLCNDDAESRRNYNPMVTIPFPKEGRYAIFIGSYDPVLRVTGRLTAQIGTETGPAVLAPAEPD
ncbi:MAG TPA: hypothetical protein PLD47_00650 [Aggregatilineales bacterium]|nr:hypothetical protein [Anaerolineales bacterium]HRE46208.1 hypothetical protein [Aggregatilineales bacterium]